MKRDASLVPLSRQHFRALVLCMRIHRKRARPSLLRWEMLTLYAEDVRFHFQAEEKFLFPAARRLTTVAPLVRDLRAEHTQLRRAFAAARRRSLTGAELTRFAYLLEGHIRKEERRLFEECQRRMSAEEMSAIGARIQRHFQKRQPASRSCKLRGSDPRG